MAVLIALLAFLVVVIALASAKVIEQLGKLEARLESIQELLAEEFRKETTYYEERKKSDRQFEEWKEITKGAGTPPPQLSEVPMPPAVVAVAQSLNRIETLLTRLVTAGERKE